ncbi:MAG: hypothetical protein JNK72_24615 [Myxococcales bacterium]|nr:hypothetical protein [Myxococcales bacterium]
MTSSPGMPALPAITALSQSGSASTVTERLRAMEAREEARLEERFAQLNARCAEIEARDKAHDQSLIELGSHRTLVKFLIGAVAAVILSLAGGAIAVRDATIEGKSHQAEVDRRLMQIEARAQQSDTDARLTREAMVRVETTLSGIQASLDHRLSSIETRLDTRSESSHERTTPSHR